MSKIFHIHLVSDSTGETVSSVTRATMVQFENVEIEEHTWPLVRTEKQMQKVLENIKQEPGLVFYTLAQEELVKFLLAECNKLGLRAVPVLDVAIDAMSKFFKMEPSAKIGVQYRLTEDYFERVNAIDYALEHDDGKAAWELNEADVVVVGVSRTSKSPTCMYLAHRGLKAGNVVFIPGCEFPVDMSTVTAPLVVGLVISPERLVQIRRMRMASMEQEEETEYSSMEVIRQELDEARRLFTKHGWPIIDVTRRSVEETAARIIQLYEKRKDEQEQEKIA